MTDIRAESPFVPWAAIDAARAEAFAANVALLDLTGPAGLGYIEKDCVAYVNARLDRLEERDDCDCPEEDR